MRDIVVIGAPAGGGAALAQLVGNLPVELDASLFVVLHSTPENPILLADVLNAPGRLRAAEALHGEPIVRRRIYVAALGKHLLIQDDAVCLSDNGDAARFRPSIDALFASAAEAYDRRVVGVLLLHAREDGSVGLRAIRSAGGRTVTHRNDLMPEPPIDAETGAPLYDEHIPLQQIPERIVSYVTERNGATEAAQQ